MKLLKKKVRKEIMFDATFWVAVSFVIFFGLLIYFKVPQNVNNLLTKMIVDIKNEIDESEKLRSEAKKLLDDAQNKLNTAEQETKKITEQAKSDSEKLIADMNEKFNKSAEIKKNLAQTKISQMKDAAIKNIKDTSIKIAIETVKKTISNSVDKSKLDQLFDKNLEETKAELKKANS
ncbi:MAG: ATPase [Proteobacteria bacterium]|jgi:F-type H+-transporting ATPase subunit b|nr:ATPase [Pseudomonadota bacterium]|tara:strand:+ start:772 stop:1302 length:531 start_codon:yes stop_codon:yes gene_type:complete